MKWKQTAAQWNVSQGFVALWKRRPTRWFGKFLTFSHMISVFFQPNWLNLGLKTQLAWKRTEFMWKNVLNLPNHLCRPSKQSLRKHSTVQLKQMQNLDSVKTLKGKQGIKRITHFLKATVSKGGFVALNLPGLQIRNVDMNSSSLHLFFLAHFGHAYFTKIMNC